MCQISSFCYTFSFFWGLIEQIVAQKVRQFNTAQTIKNFLIFLLDLHLVGIKEKKTTKLQKVRQ
jgi:type III secretory pathway component EscT